jgi:protein ImuB
MMLANARALVPALTVADVEPASDRAALTALADWCGRYSPWSAADGDDGLRLDITGCAHLFGGEAALLDDAESRLAGFGLCARGAVADTPAAAWAWAHHRPRGAGRVLPPGAVLPLQALPPAALRLPEAMVSTLEGLGLRSIGAVSALPRAPLGDRFGAILPDRLDRLFGRAPEPISPRPPVAPWRTRLIFAEPIGRREDIDLATARLAGRLCTLLTGQGLGARRLELAFYRVDWAVQRIAIGTSAPSAEPDHLLRLFALRLETVDPGFGIEAMVLEATETERMDPQQSSLGLAGEAEDSDLARLIDRLQNRLGRDRVVALAPVESHVPERAERRVPARARTTPTIRTPSPSRPLPGRALRPITLLAPPEPIEAMAPVPDDPPLSFRWRKILHRIVKADGPERIGPEWWKPQAGRSRDYYRVEDSEGRRFWVYRDGLYGATAAPSWFLHGFFP